MALMACVTGAMGQSIERATEIAIGSVNRLDTYLSPQNYKGTDIRFISDVMRYGRKDWDVKLTHEGAIDLSHNLADNADALAGHYDFAFAMLHRWKLMDGKLTLHLGGMTELYLGFAYNTHNTANNPAQGYASLTVGGSGMASYQLKIGKKTYILSYQARLPLAGIMFSPAYGQSYYELFYGGNYDSNIVFNGINTPSFRQQISVGIPVGKGYTINVGYLGDIHQAKPNNLKQHVYTNDFFIGYTKTIK